MSGEHTLHTMEKGRWLIPDHMWGAIERYIVRGIPPGSFLTAVLSNDLKGAFINADEVNTDNMRQWVQFLYNYAPGDCWGSPERVEAWLSQFRQQDEVA